jgi:hypothetical protein
MEVAKRAPDSSGNATGGRGQQRRAVGDDLQRSMVKVCCGGRRGAARRGDPQGVQPSPTATRRRLDDRHGPALSWTAGCRLALAASTASCVPGHQPQKLHGAPEISRTGSWQQAFRRRSDALHERGRPALRRGNWGDGSTSPCLSRDGACPAAAAAAAAQTEAVVLDLCRKDQLWTHGVQLCYGLSFDVTHLRGGTARGEGGRRKGVK